MKWLFLLAAFLLPACAGSPGAREATSLFGKPLARPAITPEQRTKFESDLAAAREAFKADPSEDNYIWLGRRLGYLGRIHDAIEVYSEGLVKYPKSAKLYRHRGHRFLTLR